MIYGKLNYFYLVKLGCNSNSCLGTRNKNGVSITGNVGGGLILGFAQALYGGSG